MSINPISSEFYCFQFLQVQCNLNFNITYENMFSHSKIQPNSCTGALTFMFSFLIFSCLRPCPVRQGYFDIVFRVISSRGIGNFPILDFQKWCEITFGFSFLFFAEIFMKHQLLKYKKQGKYDKPHVNKIANTILENSFTYCEHIVHHSFTPWLKHRILIRNSQTKVIDLLENIPMYNFSSLA